MRVLVLPQVLHAGEVHSVGVDHSNTRLLTAGKDTDIYLWDVAELVALNAVAEDSLKAAIDNVKIHQKFSHHTSTVKVLRWSPTADDVFVSGDESGDLYLQILGQAPKLIYPFNDSVERAQIIDVSWSPDGRLISWSSEDGKVHLFDTTRSLYQELTSLAHAEKLTIQRSLSFDPTNTFLVTLGDDTIINLYQFHYSNNNYQFKIASKITRLLGRRTINLHYKRISWSPDGDVVSIPTANKNQTVLISLLARSKDWANKLSLVGHEANCEVVQFNPFFYDSLKDKKPDTSFNVYSVVATAGSDKTLVVWNTSKDTPIFILKNLVTKAIVDICWDKTGTSVFLGSLDGHLTVVTFEEKELGTKTSASNLEAIMSHAKSTLPVFSTKVEPPSNSRKAATSIEILDEKNAVNIDEESSKKKEEPEAPVIVIEEDQSEKPLPDIQPPVDKNIPELIPAPDPDERPNEDILMSAMDNRRSNNNTSINGAKATAKAATNGTAPINEKITPEKQKVTTKNGKKRIQPLLVSNGSGPEPVDLSGSTSKSTSKPGPKQAMEFDKPSYSVGDDLFKQIKRQKQGEESTAKKPKRALEPTKFIGSVIVNPNTTFAKVRLAIPKVRLGFALTSKLEDTASFVFDVKNGSGNDTKPSRITYYKKDKQIWCDFIPRLVQLVTEGKSFWALSTNDGQIFTYSHTAGQRILPPMILGSPLSFLESHGDFLMAITCIGELYVWDMEKKKLHLRSPATIATLLDVNNKFQDDGLSRSESITMCSLTSLGIPLITLTNGAGYLFNKDLGVWQTLSETWWAFGSHYWDSLGGDQSVSKPQSSGLFGEGDDKSSIIGLLEQKTNEEIIRNTRAGRGKFFNKISKNMLMKEGFENLENTISVSHLENRILSCEILGESRDFKRFLITYVKRVCELGLKAKVFEVCNQLLAPEDEQKKLKWDRKICGLDKQELLKEIVLSCADIRDSQRILIHFSKKLGIVDNSV